MKKPIIKTSDLCKTYISDGEQFHAIRNLNMEIYEGDFTVVMGSSGSGKSTLLYLLSGLDNVTAGEVTIGDKRIDKLNEKQLAIFRRKNIGFVFQSANLVPNLTLLENIAFSGYLTEKNRSAVNKHAEDLMDMMEIGSLSKRLPSNVSGGQQQRAAIARAMINTPKVLFADEPTGALNSQQGINVLDIMTRINNNGQSVIMVTHDIKAACRGDRLLFISDGRIDGDLRLGKYQPENMESREKQVFSYLTEKGW
jgi:putative ABC transport system ATP-binding protein